MEKFVFNVESDYDNCRLDVFLTQNLQNQTRNGVQKLVEKNLVYVNEKNCKSNYKLKIGDCVEISMPELVETNILPEDIPLDIVYEDDDVIVINKPQGMVVHPAPGHYEKTLVNAVMYHCKGNLSGINGEIRPGIVHRIDKDTSGVIVVAKNDNAHNFLAKQWEVHSITRKYYALVFNNIKDDCGTINKPIARHKIDRKKMAIAQVGGREAITHFKVLERFGRYTLVEAQLETGRTHQIRVHLASIGNPLVGDLLYGQRKQPFNLLGQVLHAGVLGFCHPTKNEYMEFTSDLPPYFQALLKKL